jgi:hypothetical protein
MWHSEPEDPYPDQKHFGNAHPDTQVYNVYGSATQQIKVYARKSVFHYQKKIIRDNSQCFIGYILENNYIRSGVVARTKYLKRHQTLNVVFTGVQ